MKLNAAFFRFANDTGLGTAYAIAVIDQIREAKREGFPTEELTDEVLARMLGLTARRFAGRELSKHYVAYEAAQAEREDVPLASPLSPVTPIPPIIPPEEKDALSARDAREASAERKTKEREERREWSNDTEDEFDDSFEQFWAAYPRKAGKEGARRVWRKERLGKRADEIISAIERKRYSSDWTKENGRFIPYPQKYLTEHRWEDEQDSDWNAQCGTASDDEFDLVWGCYTEKDNELLRSCIDE